MDGLTMTGGDTMYFCRASRGYDVFLSGIVFILNRIQLSKKLPPVLLVEKPQYRHLASNLLVKVCLTRFAGYWKANDPCLVVSKNHLLT